MNVVFKCLEMVHDKIFSDKNSKLLLKAHTDENNQILIDESKIQTNISNSLVYLIHHQNYELKRKVEDELNKISENRIIEILTNIAVNTFQENEHILENIRGVIPNTIWPKLGNAREAAETYVEFCNHSNDQIIKQSTLLKIGSTINRIVTNIFANIFTSNSFNFDRVSTDSYQAQQRIMFYRQIMRDGYQLGKFVFKWIKIALASSLAIPLIRNVSEKLFFQKINKISRLAIPLIGLSASLSFYKISKSINQIAPHYLPFFNYSLNRIIEEKTNYIPPIKFNNSIDYVSEIKKSLTRSNIVPCLIGPPGVGKTELIELFTLDLMKKQPGTVVFKGKMADLCSNEAFSYSEEEAIRLSPLDKVKSYLTHVPSGKVVLFIDEFACAFKNVNHQNGEPIGDMYDVLINMINEDHVKLIFATTQEEYDAYIAHLSPLVERMNVINISEPPRDILKVILANKAQNFINNNAVDIDVTSEAIDEIIEMSKKLPGANPRKAINLLTNFMSQIKEYKLKKDSSIIAIKEGINDLKQKIKSTNGVNPNFIFTQECSAIKKNIQYLSKKLEDLKIKRKQQKSDFSDIQQLTGKIKHLSKRCLFIAQKIKRLSTKKLNSIQLDKEFILLKRVIIPAILKIQDNKIIKFNKKYNEKLNFVLDEVNIKKLSKVVMPSLIQNKLMNFFFKFLQSKNEVKDSHYGITNQQVREMVESLLKTFPISYNQNIDIVFDKNSLINFFQQFKQTHANLAEDFDDEVIKAMIEKLILNFPVLKEKNIEETFIKYESVDLC
ncbi:MAG: AAA family ATPase [Parachlamydiaceae bacterium]|nr:AAA family ATPase [Parachlamydiaceae bacterium]